MFTNVNNLVSSIKTNIISFNTLKWLKQIQSSNLDL